MRKIQKSKNALLMSFLKKKMTKLKIKIISLKRKKLSLLKNNQLLFIKIFNKKSNVNARKDFQ